MSKTPLAPDASLFEQLIDTTQDAVILIDGEAKIVRFNSTAESMFGYDAEQVLGRNVSLLMPAPYRAEHDGYIARYERTGEARAIGQIRKVDARRSDGDSFPIELSVTKLNGVHGVSYAAFIRDVSALRREETRLRRLIELTQDAVVFVDHQARIVLFNAAAQRTFGWRFEEVEGENVRVLMPELIAAKHDSYIQHYERTGEGRAVNHIRSIQGRRKSGEIFPIEISVTSIDDDAQVRYAAFIRDTTQQELIAQQLIDRERLAAIGTTAATFAHEIGNPLNSMYMNAQLLERQLAKAGNAGGDPRIAARVAAISTEITRLNLLLHEFRALSRRQRLDFTRFDLVRYIRTLLDQDGPSHRDAQVQVSMSAAPATIAIEADRTKFAQVFLNLTKNAVEAMPQGGRLDVCLRTEGEFAVLEVRDSGCGVDPQVDIFAPFASTKPEGTGLGLAVVQRIIAGHGGSIGYESQLDHGTCFVLRLPLRRTNEVD